MPLGVKPVCSACKSNASTMWSKSDKGEIICNECVTKQTHGCKEQNGNGLNQSKKGGLNSESAQERVLRKSSRNKPSKYRVSAKPVATKGKGRRIIFKKSVSGIHVSQMTQRLYNKTEIFLLLMINIFPKTVFFFVCLK